MKEILQFSSEGCGPCKQLSPKMEKLQSEGKIKYKKVDVDVDLDLVTKYGIRTIPTLILINSSGEVLNRMSGNQDEQSILNFYNK